MGSMGPQWGQWDPNRVNEINGVPMGSMRVNEIPIGSMRTMGSQWGQWGHNGVPMGSTGSVGDTAEVAQNSAM